MITEQMKPLIEKYPTLFRQCALPMSESCMAFGIECGTGWYPTINFMSKALIKKYGDKIEYSQIKEKFGTLRVYVDILDDSIDWKEVMNLISKYEVMSSKKCERCGKPASMRNVRGWFSTLCDEHFKEKEELLNG